MVREEAWRMANAVMVLTVNTSAIRVKKLRVRYGNAGKDMDRSGHAWVLAHLTE